KSLWAWIRSVGAHAIECSDMIFAEAVGGKVWPRNWAGLSMLWKKSVSPARGGSPFQATARGEFLPCLPRTRGFTLLPGIGLLVFIVSPPHAGVHLIPMRPILIRSSVSPARGGSPWDIANGGANPLCLPRTRGFTLLPGIGLLVFIVSPPHAGVHL